MRPLHLGYIDAFLSHLEQGAHGPEVIHRLDHLGDGVIDLGYCGKTTQGKPD
jgi:hypothetical protein